MKIVAAIIFAVAVCSVCRHISTDRIVASCGSPSRVADELNAAIQLIRKYVPESQSFAIHVDDLKRMDSLHRQVIAAVSFDRLPNRVIVTDTEAEFLDSDWVLTGRWSLLDWQLSNNLTAYRMVDETPFLSLYTRVPSYCVLINDFSKMDIASLMRMVVAAIFVFVLVGIVTVTCVGKFNRLSTEEMTAVIIVGIVLAILCILTHTLRSPNGTAVYAGKAKLWCQLGMPHDFFTNKSWEVYLPAYPPGLTILSGVYYLVAGVFDNWLVQIVPFAGSFWCMYILYAYTRNIVNKSAVLLFFSLPTSVYLSCGFYAESYVALLMIIFFLRIEQGRDGCLTWFLAGLAGIFKNEGLVFYIIACISYSIIVRRVEFAKFLVGIVPALVWYAVVIVSGGYLPGYEANGFGTIFAHIFLVGEEIVWLLCHDLGIGVWGMVILPLFVWHLDMNKTCRLTATLTLTFVWLSLLSIIFIYGICTHWDITWRIKSSLFRFLWIPSVISFYGLLSIAQGVKRSMVDRKLL